MLLLLNSVYEQCLILRDKNDFESGLFLSQTLIFEAYKRFITAIYSLI